MRPVTDILNNGKTRTAFSCLRPRHLKTSTDTEKVFSFFLADARFGFDKPVLAIPNLAHSYFSAPLQNPNKLSCLRSQIGVLCTLVARLLDATKGAPQAYGIFLIHNDP